MIIASFSVFWCEFLFGHFFFPSKKINSSSFSKNLLSKLVFHKAHVQYSWYILPDLRRCGLGDLLWGPRWHVVENMIWQIGVNHPLLSWKHQNFSWYKNKRGHLWCKRKILSKIIIKINYLGSIIWKKQELSNNILLLCKHKNIGASVSLI